MARHSAVCHNLLRVSKSQKTAEDVEQEPVYQPANPLRKPHAQAAHAARRDQAPSSNQKPTQYNNRAPRINNSKDRQTKKPMNNTNSNDIQSSNTPKPPVDQLPKPKANGVTPVSPVSPVTPTVQPQTAPAQKATRPAETLDTTNECNLVPKTCVLDVMSVGDTTALSVDARAEDCGTRQTGFVCLSISEKTGGDFQRLFGEFGEVCAAAERIHRVSPGDSFAYFDATDEGWYRARCLSTTSAALVDGCKLVRLADGDRYASLPAEYAAIPEYCCVLLAVGVTLGNSLVATLVAKTATGFKVSLKNAEEEALVGEGEVSRWLPDIEYPKPKSIVSAPVIPDVTRPDVTHNSKVLLVEASAVDRVLVRSADREAVRRFDSLLEDVVMYGMKAEPLTEPPTKGQTVIGVFSDGLHYRALCRRTNVKQNKYLLEYIEFGNTEISPLEKLYPCPAELSLASQPTEVSLVRLQTTVTAFTANAQQYLEKIRDDNEELLLTLPSGETAASTGAEVCLTIAKNKESVNRKVTEMCTPEWKKMEERGADVIESEVIMNDQVKYLDLPEDGCELDVLDVSALACGSVSACERGSGHARYVLGALTDRMAEYCNSQLGREPYLPALMEVCIAKCPPYPQWFRAVLVDHRPGDAEAKVCYMDYGNIESVPVSQLRKMLPEFIRDVPALALHIEINGFPPDPTPQQLGRAVTHMELTEEGRGTLRVTRCQRRVHGVYEVDAPALLQAMMG